MKKINHHYHNLTKFILLLGFLLSSSCAYQDRVQPIKLPSSSNNSISINGLYISAVSFQNSKSAKKTFGFNIREAGLLPVQIVFQNEGKNNVKLVPEQTFLLDSKDQAWPINTLKRTYERVEKYVEVGETISGSVKPALFLGAAGAIVGFAVGIVTGGDLGESIGKGAALGASAGAITGGTVAHKNARGKITTDLKEKSLKKEAILPGQIAYGILFFPGFPEEAQSASKLKISLSFDGIVKAATLDLLPYSD